MKNTSICVLPLLSDYYNYLWSDFISVKQSGRVRNKLFIFIDENY